MLGAYLAMRSHLRRHSTEAEGYRRTRIAVEIADRTVVVYQHQHAEGQIVCLRERLRKAAETENIVETETEERRSLHRQGRLEYECLAGGEDKRQD